MRDGSRFAQRRIAKTRIQIKDDFQVSAAGLAAYRIESKASSRRQLRSECVVSSQRDCLSIISLKFVRLWKVSRSMTHLLRYRFVASSRIFDQALLSMVKHCGSLFRGIPAIDFVGGGDIVTQMAFIQWDGSSFIASNFIKRFGIRRRTMCFFVQQS